MTYDWTVSELVELSRVNPAECPPGEEGEWCYIAENAALEARLRLEAGCKPETAKVLMKAIPKLERIARVVECKAALRGERVQ